MDDYETEKLYRCYVNDDGVSIQIHPSPDVPNCIRITTMHCEKSKEHFGHLDITLDEKFAVMVAKAILDCSTDLK